MITCTRSIEFDAAHRVMNHESKCATLHGHRYVIEIKAVGELDPIGRVIDFSVLKKLIGGWVDEHWDHTSIINVQDTKTVNALQQCPSTKQIYLCMFNPTAENMADHLLTDVCPKLMEGTGVKVIEVTVWETPNCKATATL